MATLRACYSLFRIRLAESIQYRMAAITGSLVGIFWAIVEVVIYRVFYMYGHPPTDGLTLTQVISYAWLGQVLFMLQPMSVDGDILTKITSGDVGVELCRPLDLYGHWFAKTAAGRLSGWIRGVITLVVGLLVPMGWGLGAPASWEGFCLFVVSVFCAFLLCASYGMLITAVRVGLTWGEGPTWMLLLLGGVLSGGYLPLQLWPQALQGILLLQPFAGYMDIPLRLYMGSMPLSQAGWALLLQVVWTAVFIVLGKAIMQRKIRNVIVQGG